jgi:nucleoside-diphosphate-sugar epimerase
METRGLDVSEEAARHAEDLGAEVVVGDVRDEEAVEAFVDGCDLVIHTAAIVGEGGDMSLYRDVNVGGTRRVVSAAAEAGVEHFIQISSVMVYGFDFPADVDEEGPLRGEGNAYCQTKIESERVARSHHGEGGMEVTVARPGDIYGPRSQPWVVRPLELMKQRLFVLPDGGRGMLDPTYVSNVVDALFLLLEERPGGEVFNVTDGLAMEARAYFAHLADMLGGRFIPTAPAPLLKVLFGAVGAAFRAVGQEPPATPDAVDFLNLPGGYANDKILELGHEPAVGLAEGMANVEEWARDEGLL